MVSTPHNFPHGRAASRRWLPRSFYARAALILVLPVVVLQCAVAVMFLQRHYEDVTDQMTANMTREMALVRARPELASALEIDLIEPPEASRMRFYDLSGRAMLSRLDRSFEDLAHVDLVSERKVVRVGFEDGTGLSFDRANVSASNPHQLLVLMVVVALLMTAISFLFMRGQIRPIRRLARAAEAFGRGERSEYRPTGASEVRQAGTAFLEMRSRIERHIEQRTLLLSGVSHDLRTPLTRMKLELSMMDGEEAAALSRDVEAMERIVTTFLDFARAEASDAPAETDIAGLLRDLVRGEAPEAELAGSLKEGGSDVMTVMPTGLSRGVANLIGNARRYGDRIRVGLNPGTTASVISVEDDGPGIPEDQREAAMRPFGRLDSARSNTEGNVGLGLAIVRDVARAHGGSLRLGRSDLGGLKAEIVLPR
ncbi:ATP-binding protein [Jannaschia aquimarina]|uniref:histidine kinase n=1 Tax=Jannaschia aquimarina TaxID=935700 RepID=A0A0D1EJJ8_9RHOB|nr:ATP-binding protein [Jannaschia aquimarina]KIT17161.1 Osmolarity sensor protein EnvZ [Jannaschia aquimarina]SNT17576.1 two-component system, OmpR family, osmolarity sensor histidine kinase EnvZ [Jannaschia aquimarina]